MDGDLSLWPNTLREFIDYLKYKKFGIKVYSVNIGGGYKRLKMIKK